MKTNVRSVRFVSLGVAIAAVLVAHPMRAVPIVNNIIITENSSTSLTVTYDGSTSGVTVTPGVLADTWTVTVSTAAFGMGSIVDWTEPENASNSNNVAFGTSVFFNEFTVLSDANISAGAVGNGTTVPIPFSTDTSNGGSISATFNDNGDVASAPDTGSTFGLLLLALAVLVDVSRLRSFRLA